MFMLAILCLGKMADGLAPMVIGMLVASIGMSFGSTTGYALNPARDFWASSSLHAFTSSKSGTLTNWGYAWVPIVGPLIGGALAVIFFQCVGV